VLRCQGSRARLAGWDAGNWETNSFGESKCVVSAVRIEDEVPGFQAGGGRDYRIAFRAEGTNAPTAAAVFHTPKPIVDPACAPQSASPALLLERGGDLVSPTTAPRPTGTCRNTYIVDTRSYPAPVIGSTVTLQDNVLTLDKANCEALRLDVQAWEITSSSSIALGRVEKFGRMVTDLNDQQHCMAPTVHTDRDLPVLAGRRDKRVRLAIQADKLGGSGAPAVWRTVAFSSIDAPQQEPWRQALNQVQGFQTGAAAAISAGTITSTANLVWNLKGTHNAQLRCRLAAFQAAALKLSRGSLTVLGASASTVDAAIAAYGAVSGALCGASGTVSALQRVLHDTSVAILNLHSEIRARYEYENGEGNVDWLAAEALNSAMLHDLGSLVKNCGLEAYMLQSFLYAGTLPSQANGSLERAMLGTCSTGASDTLPAAAGRLGLGSPAAGRSLTQARDVFQTCIADEAGQAVCNGDPRASGGTTPETPPAQEGTTCGSWGGLWGCVTTKDGVTEVTQCESEATGEACNAQQRDTVLDEGSKAGKSEAAQGVQGQQVNQGANGQPVTNPATNAGQNAATPPDVPPPGMSDRELGMWTNDVIAVGLGIGFALVATTPVGVALAAVGTYGALCSIDAERCGNYVRAYAPYWTQFQCNPELDMPNPSSWYVKGFGRTARPMVEENRVNHCLCEVLDSAYAGGSATVRGLQSTMCPDPQERLAQECLDNPWGPDDGRDPACVLLANSAQGPIDGDVLLGRMCDQIQCLRDEVKVVKNGRCVCELPLPTGGGAAIPCRNGEISLCWDTDGGTECGCDSFNAPNGGLGCRLDTIRALTKRELVLPDWDAAYSTRLNDVTDVLRLRSDTEITTRELDVREFPVRGDVLRADMVQFERAATSGPNQVFVHAYYTNLDPIDPSGRLSNPAPINNHFLGQCDLTAATTGQLTGCDFRLGTISNWPDQDSGARATVDLARLEGRFAVTWQVFSPDGYGSRVGLGPVRLAGNTVPLPTGGTFPDGCGPSPGPGPDPSPISWVPLLNPTYDLVDEGIWPSVSSDQVLRVRPTVFAALRSE
jgi:hypothetical protein